MRILIVTDAWFPQVNGVVRTLSTVAGELESQGYKLSFVTPDQFPNLPCPTYPEIRLAIAPFGRLRRLADDFAPEAIHIATEGPLGWAARRYCLHRRLPFTTSFHTRFPEYVHARARVPVTWSYGVMRRFHSAARRTMVATQTLRDVLQRRGFGDTAIWSRGVNLSLFRPRAKRSTELPRPLWLYVGRVAVEKSIEDFVKLELPGSKVVVGDGPEMSALKRRYPEVHFRGAKQGESLAAEYSDADVFVFPSRTDTFGNVVLEALASGVPVAAYPVPGPKDIIAGQPVGVLDEDLARAARTALGIRPELCRAFAETFSWRASADQFVSALAPITR